MRAGILTSWLPCPWDLNFVTKAKSKWSRTTSTGLLSVLSFQLPSLLFTCQQLCPEAMSLHSRLLLGCLTPHNYCKDDGVYMLVEPYWPLIWLLAYFFKDRKYRSVLMPLWMSKTIYFCKSCSQCLCFHEGSMHTFTHPSTSCHFTRCCWINRTFSKLF